MLGMLVSFCASRVTIVTPAERLNGHRKGWSLTAKPTEELKSGHFSVEPQTRKSNWIQCDKTKVTHCNCGATTTQDVVLLCSAHEAEGGESKKIYFHSWSQTFSLSQKINYYLLPLGSYLCICKMGQDISCQLIRQVVKM